jgi:hypothetical protein
MSERRVKEYKFLYRLRPKYPYGKLARTPPVRMQHSGQANTSVCLRFGQEEPEYRLPILSHTPNSVPEVHVSSANDADCAMLEVETSSMTAVTRPDAGIYYHVVRFNRTGDREMRNGWVQWLWESLELSRL